MIHRLDSSLEHYNRELYMERNVLFPPFICKGHILRPPPK